MQFTKAPRLYWQSGLTPFSSALFLGLEFSDGPTVVLGLDLTLGVQGNEPIDNYLLTFTSRTIYTLALQCALGGRLVAITGVHMCMSDLIIAGLSCSSALLRVHCPYWNLSAEQTWHRPCLPTLPSLAQPPPTPFFFFNISHCSLLHPLWLSFPLGMLVLLLQGGYAM